MVEEVEVMAEEVEAMVEEEADMEADMVWKHNL